jgi:uncharacterized protein HemX
MKTYDKILLESAINILSEVGPMPDPAEILSRHVKTAGKIVGGVAAVGAAGIGLGAYGLLKMKKKRCRRKCLQMYVNNQRAQQTCMANC